MTQYVFEPQAPVTVPVVGCDEQFPVRRVYCVGRNYAAHAREMGFDPDREPPFFFCKPADAVVPVAAGQTLELPYPSRRCIKPAKVWMLTMRQSGCRSTATIISVAIFATSSGL